MNLTDTSAIQEAVRRARLGDTEAFGELYATFFVPLYRYIYFRVSEKEDANDLAQDVFLKAYASFQNYVPSHESPLPYFYTIARNSIIDYYRKKKVPTLEDEVMQAIPDTTPSVEDEAMMHEDFALIERQLSQLSPDQQDALILKYLNGRTNTEIAKMMGKSEAAIRQLQSRGLKALRELCQR